MDTGEGEGTTRGDPPRQACVKDLLQFCETSSVKGVPKIVRARSLVHRVLWIFAVVVGTLVGSYQVYQLARIYLMYSTTISMEKSKDRLAFPDVTVCNLNIIWTQTPAHHFETPTGSVPDTQTLTFDQYLEAVSRLENNISNGHMLARIGSSIGYLEYFVTHNEVDLEKRMIVDCQWELENAHPKCSDVTFPFHSPQYGPCFTFSLPASLSSATGAFTAIVHLSDFAEESILGHPTHHAFSFGRGVRVMVHAPNTMPEMSRGFNIPPGHETTVKLRSVKRIMMDYPYGECSMDAMLTLNDAPQDYEKNTGRSRYHRKLERTTLKKRNYAYTSYACENMCKQKEVISQCGCLDMDAIASPEQREWYKACGVLDIANASRSVASLLCADWAYIMATEACDCPEQCTQDQYEVSTYRVPWPHENFQLAFYNQYIKPARFAPLFSFYQDVEDLMTTNKSQAFRMLRESDLLRRNFLQLNVYMEDQGTTRMVDKPAISPEALFGNVGGILNLWIGITFITLIEVVDLWLALMRSGLQPKDRGRKAAHLQDPSDGHVLNKLSTTSE